MLPTSFSKNWSHQVSSVPSNSDELWEVEWGSIQDKRKSSWASSRSNTWKQSECHYPAQRPPQAIYCVPFAFMVNARTGTSSGIPLCSLPPVIPSVAATQNKSYEASREKFPSSSPSAVDSCAETGSNANVIANSEELAEGDLPSVGSAAHSDGTCKRCAFYPKGRCRNGADCAHCHFDHAPRARTRKRGRKEQNDNRVPLSAETVESEEDDVQLVAYSRQKDDVLEEETAVPSSSDYEEETITEEVAILGLANMPENADLSESSVAGSSDSEIPVSQVSTTASSPRKSVQPSKRESLKVSPTSWAAQQRIRRATLEGQDDISHDVGRKARALLNKLTEERFESLCAQILALPFSTSAELATIAEEIFEKATTQNGFRSLYSELCLRIDAHLSKETSEIGGKAFRKELAKECQTSFERHLQSTDISVLENLADADRLEQEIILKTHRIGNIRFIGELLVRRLLAPKLIAPIVHELLNGDELALESLVALLTILAPCFEQKQSLYQAPLKEAFATLCRKQSDKNLSLRVRCQLNDLFDARARSWASRLTAS